MASARYVDMLQQGFMKQPKAKRTLKTQEEKAAELSRLAGVPITTARNNLFRVPHPAGYDNFLNYKDAKILAKLWK